MKSILNQNEINFKSEITVVFNPTKSERPVMNKIKK